MYSSLWRLNVTWLEHTKWSSNSSYPKFPETLFILISPFCLTSHMGIVSIFCLFSKSFLDPSSPLPPWLSLSYCHQSPELLSWILTRSHPLNRSPHQLPLPSLQIFLNPNQFPMLPILPCLSCNGVQLLPPEIRSMLVFYCYYNKLPWIWWLKTISIYYLTDCKPEVRYRASGFSIKGVTKLKSDVC